jgi:dTDP-4-dehydrorhamnose reductase
MRVLVTGAAGMLGSAVVPSFVSRGHEVVATDIDLSDPRPWGVDGPTITYLDVRSRQDLDRAVRAIDCDVVLHLAAMTDLEECEADPSGAFHTNALGAKFVALACLNHGAEMAYISTAGVFDGTKAEPYSEFDRPNPINVYGKSKYEGERLVQNLVSRSYVVRAGWMIGGGRKDHKFVARILDQVSQGKTEIFAVGDKLGTPTYAPDFAHCFALLVESGVYGLYHMACGGSGSRYDVAVEIVSILGRDDISVCEVDSGFFQEEFPTRRPRSEIMINEVLGLQRMDLMRPWRIALREYLEEEYPHLVSARPERSADRLMQLRVPERALHASAG